MSSIFDKPVIAGQDIVAHQQPAQCGLSAGTEGERRRADFSQPGDEGSRGS